MPEVRITPKRSVSAGDTLGKPGNMDLLAQFAYQNKKSKLQIPSTAAEDGGNNARDIRTKTADIEINNIDDFFDWDTLPSTDVCTSASPSESIEKDILHINSFDKSTGESQPDTTDNRNEISDSNPKSKLLEKLKKSASKKINNLVSLNSSIDSSRQYPMRNRIHDHVITTHYMETSHCNETSPVTALLPNAQLSTNKTGETQMAPQILNSCNQSRTFGSFGALISPNGLDLSCTPDVIKEPSPQRKPTVSQFSPVVPDEPQDRLTDLFGRLKDEWKTNKCRLIDDISKDYWNYYHTLPRPKKQRIVAPIFPIRRGDDLTSPNCQRIPLTSSHDRFPAAFNNASLRKSHGAVSLIRPGQTIGGLEALKSHSRLWNDKQKFEESNIRGRIQENDTAYSKFTDLSAFKQWQETQAQKMTNLYQSNNSLSVSEPIRRDSEEDCDQTMTDALERLRRLRDPNSLPCDDIVQHSGPQQPFCVKVANASRDHSAAGSRACTAETSNLNKRIQRLVQQYTGHE